MRAAATVAAAGIALLVLELAASPGIARPPPPGCNLGVEKQSLSARVGRAQTFRFDGYNAVPPGHTATGVRIAWGDRSTTAGKASTRSRATKKGCFDTVFSGRHAYKHVTCRGGV
jgi:hypothetical protein